MSLRNVVLLVCSLAVTACGELPDKEQPVSQPKPQLWAGETWQSVCEYTNCEWGDDNDHFYRTVAARYGMAVGCMRRNAWGDNCPCSGTMISDRHFVTADHCLNRNDTGRFFVEFGRYTDAPNGNNFVRDGIARGRFERLYGIHDLDIDGLNGSENFPACGPQMPPASPDCRINPSFADDLTIFECNLMQSYAEAVTSQDLEFALAFGAFDVMVLECEANSFQGQRLILPGEVHGYMKTQEDKIPMNFNDGAVTIGLNSSLIQGQTGRSQVLLDVSSVSHDRRPDTQDDCGDDGNRPIGYDAGTCFSTTWGDGLPGTSGGPLLKLPELMLVGIHSQDAWYTPLVWETAAAATRRIEPRYNSGQPVDFHLEAEVPRDW